MITGLCAHIQAKKKVCRDSLSNAKALSIP